MLAACLLFGGDGDRDFQACLEISGHGRCHFKASSQRRCREGVVHCRAYLWRKAVDDDQRRLMQIILARLPYIEGRGHDHKSVILLPQVCHYETIGYSG